MHREADELERLIKVDKIPISTSTGVPKVEDELALLLTQDPRMEELKNKVRKLAALTITEPVLIRGDTGTGKEHIARALHGERKGPIVCVNCTALPSELMESELFGHKVGSFTGAVKDRIGKFVAANNGTLFLDEIGDMPLGVQAKLLRAIQFGVVTPLGSNDEVKVNARIVAATHQDVTDVTIMREDLYFRLSTFVLKTIPLSNRTR
jgi:DNA-binding NtrC family response regulator